MYRRLTNTPDSLSLPGLPNSQSPPGGWHWEHTSQLAPPFKGPRNTSRRQRAPLGVCPGLSVQNWWGLKSKARSGLTTSQAQAWVQAVAGCGRLPTLPRLLSSLPLPTLAPAKRLQVGPETANRLGPRHMKVCESLAALIPGAAETWSLNLTAGSQELGKLKLAPPKMRRAVADRAPWPTPPSPQVLWKGQ